MIALYFKDTLGEGRYPEKDSKSIMETHRGILDSFTVNGCTYPTHSSLTHESFTIRSCHFLAVYIIEMPFALCSLFVAKHNRSTQVFPSMSNFILLN